MSRHQLLLNSNVSQFEEVRPVTPSELIMYEDSTGPSEGGRNVTEDLASSL